MAIKKNVPIKYTSRDYASIREDLIQHAKGYYPDTFKDFNEAGFGSLMLDTVSYVGDVMSFYLDYQANESFLSTATEFQNVIKLGQQMGYRFKENPSSHGVCTFFVLVPANETGTGPDARYIPILKRGSLLSSTDGNSFLLDDDVFFSDPSNEVVVGRVNDDTGVPTAYAIRAYGKIVSGKFEQVLVPVGEFKRFLNVRVNLSNVAEVISVFDTEGHEYFEVSYLSQDVVYKPVTNRTLTTNDQASALLKPFTVPRRFVVVPAAAGGVALQFGTGDQNSTTTTEKVADPSNVTLEIFGKDYISDTSFDPTNLIKTDKMGVSPVNTTLRVVCRTNDRLNVNAGSDSITNVDSSLFEFDSEVDLSPVLTKFVRNSLESTNEEPVIGDTTFPSVNELKVRINDSFATQNRAVTRQDYQSLIYSMPPKFGSVKRVNITRDPDSLKRNLNLYVVAENVDGSLTMPNSVVKENLKMWLNENRMINDTIDIIDGKIVNLAVEFVAVGDLETNRFDLLDSALINLRRGLLKGRDLGEPFFVTDIYDLLKEVDGIVDVSDVKVTAKNGSFYSDVKFNVKNNTSADGRYIKCPDNVVFELKFPNSDIKGAVE